MAVSLITRLSIFLTLLAGFAFSAYSVQAQTNLSTALERMDEIIAEMQSLRTEFAQLQNSVATAPSPSPTVLGAATSCGDILTGSLENGDTSEDIARIQRLLATDPAIYPYGVDSGFYGEKTTDAIRNLQTRFGLDPVGVVGPATTALLKAIMCAYPDENYPDGVLDKKPQVAGAQTSVVTTVATPVATTPNPTPTTNLEEIEIEIDGGEAWIEIDFIAGSSRTLAFDSDDEDDIVEFIAEEVNESEANVRRVMDLEESDRGGDYDEDDADDALDDAEDAIDDAEDEIDEAEEDDEDTDWAEDTLDEAEDLLEEAEEAYEDEDWDEAVELAEEAEEMAEEAIDRIDEEEEKDSDDIDEIKVEIEDGEAEVTVEYEDGDEEEFTIEDDDEDDIIEEIADELDIDEEDVEDLVEFEYEYGDLDEVLVDIDEDEEEAQIEVVFEDGTDKNFKMNTTDEDDIIEEIADRYDLDEDDIEDVIDFDYN